MVCNNKFSFIIINHLVPVQVSDVSVNAVTSTSMTVTWTSLIYSDITQYNSSYVTSCSLGQTISNSTTVTHPTTSVTLTDLEEGLNYTITVTAVNVLGESTATLIVQGTNATGSSMYVLIYLCISFLVPSGSPINVSVSYINDTAVNVSWSGILDCFDENGAITGYLVNVTGVPSFSTTFNAKHIVISSLSSGVYTVSVAAINDAGWGPFSSSTNFTIG